MGGTKLEGTAPVDCEQGDTVKIGEIIKYLSESHAREISSLKESHERELITMKECHNREISSLKESHAREVDIHNKKVEFMIKGQKTVVDLVDDIKEAVSASIKL